MYAAGCARSDFTTCLPVPLEGQGPGLNKLFFGYSILGESVLGPVLPLPLNRSGASGQAQTWTAGRSCSVVQDALEFAEIRPLFLVFWCAKKEPLGHFSIMGHMVAYGSNAPQN